MGKAGKSSRHPEASLYRRNASRVTAREVLHPIEKQALIAQAPPLRRRKVRSQLEARWAEEERRAGEEVGALLQAIRVSVDDLSDALNRLEAVRAAELLGKVEAEQQRAKTARAQLEAASEALSRVDFGAAGAALEEAERELWMIGGRLIVAVNKALSQAAVSKEFRARLEDNLAERRQAKLALERVRSESRPALLEAAARLRHLDAAGYRLAAEILSAQVRREPAVASTERVGREGELRVVPPQECETFSDVGGLESVKDELRQTIGAILERPDEAAKYHVVHNGILLYGPPGTGKNLLSRALAGEYGLRYVRFSPAAIASVYIHEAASNLRHLFELASRNTPCVLFLDEIDTIASARGDEPSPDHREVVTQLMVCLEEYRTTPGLVIVAASNELDRLDPALREGRFDARIHLPLPDPEARAEILGVHLNRRGDAVLWKGVDLSGLAGVTSGYNAAALETVVSRAAQKALKDSKPITQKILLEVVSERGGKDRITVEERISWDDVVLTSDVRDHLIEILTVFSQPDLARELGVSSPVGVLLHGPPGTGKTTIAKAMASQVHASFYELSAAQLISKWAGESEQRVAKLFSRARANRPSIVFIDEVDALLRRRSADSAAKWEERVVSQFLQELDGLKGGEGVLFVGATNRPDAVDDAIVGRRLVPIEVSLPDPAGRLELLKLLCREVRLAQGVNLRSVAKATEGMSGADLKRLRDSAGMKALGRIARNGRAPKGKVSVEMDDFEAALEAQRGRASFEQV